MLSFLKRLGILEWTLIQIIFYLILWLTNEYVAVLITSTLILIFIGILVVSLLAETIERSKVPKAYFKFMIISIVIPILISIYFYKAYEGVFDFLK